MSRRRYAPQSLRKKPAKRQYRVVGKHGATPTTTTTSTAIVPGITRTSGFYGRFFPSGTEYKFFDTAVTGGAMAATGTILNTSLNLVDQGNAENNVIGRSMVIKSIYMRCRIREPDSSNATQGNVINNDSFRIVLLLDKQANGAAPTIAQIFEQATIRGHLNLEYSQRFVVLKEFHGSLNSTINHNGTVFFSGGSEKYWTWYRKCEIPVEFGVMAGANRVIGEIRSNNLVLVTFSAAGTALLEHTTRIRFSDS